MFYFGSLLLLFGVEILSDWLIRSWAKVTKKEYLLLWATFLAVMLGMPALQCVYAVQQDTATLYSMHCIRSGPW